MKHYYLNFCRLLLLVLAMLTPDLLLAQERTVSGVVLEEGTSTGIPGANVRVKGTTAGAVTDLEGNYQIAVPGNDAVLVFSFVGYISEEETVGNRSTIDVSLAQDVQKLEELVVVGYGTQERARVTGAISSVSSKEINEQPVASVDQALQGRAAGVTVANTGSPGVNPIVRIRGMGSVGDNNPLYVIDGMPAGGLNEVNPNDIESIQVLKDASAAAIYGSRAANGVIMVTTKKGTKGKTTINFDSYYGVQNAWKQLDLLNTAQYIQYGRNLLGEGAPARFDDLGEFAGVDTDWQDEMFRTAPIQDYNLSVSGGGDNSLFNVGGGYFKQDGIMLGTGFERYSFRANSEFTIGRLKVGETLTVARTKRQNEPYNGGRSQIEHMIKMIPYVPVRDPDFINGFRNADAEDLSDPENPVLNAHLFQNWDENIKLLGTAYASFEILDGLEYKFLVGMDMNFGYNEQFTPVIVSSDALHLNPTADFSQDRSDFISPLFSNQLSFSKTFGDHHIDAIGVVEQQTWTRRNTLAAGETDLTSAIDVLDIASNPNISGSRTEYALISYLARVNYDYAGKYLFGASVRRDGGSNFGEEKWGTFPSVSAGWRISEEGFLKNSGAVSDLKLRASWGQVGNDRIGQYRYQSTFTGGTEYVFGPGAVQAPGITSNAMGNQAIKWETTTMTNIGLDLGFLNEKIRASVEYFNNQTDDLLLEVPIAPSLGLDNAPYANVGSVVNKGFEFTAGYYEYSGDFQWSLGGNISFVQNELTSLGIGNELTGAQFEGTSITHTTEGEPIAYFRGYVVDRLYQSQAEVDADAALDGDASTPYQLEATTAGDIRFKDLSGPEGVPDGVINDFDRTNIGHFLPDFSYGINGSANYKNFDLTLFFQGVSGNEIFNTNIYDLQGMPRLFNAGVEVLDAWTPENTDTNIPRAANGDPAQNARISDRYIEDGSYFRLKNLTIGYAIPAPVLENLGNGFIKNVRLYVTGQNLLTFTDYSGYDPEIGARPDLAADATNATLNSGVDWGQYPQARTFLGGIQIGF